MILKARTACSFLQRIEKKTCQQLAIRNYQQSEANLDAPVSVEIIHGKMHETSIPMSKAIPQKLDNNIIIYKQ